QTLPAPGSELGGDYAVTSEPGAQLDFAFNGQRVEIIYAQGPDQGQWAVLLDGEPVPDVDSGAPLVIDAYNPTLRFDLRQSVQAAASGEHTLSLVNAGQGPGSQGTGMAIGGVSVLPGVRQSNLGLIIGLIAGLEAIGLALAFLFGPALFS